MTSSCDARGRRPSAAFAPSPHEVPGAFARLDLTGDPVDPAPPIEAPPEPPRVEAESLQREAYEEGRAAALAELPWREVEALEQARASLEAAAGALAELRSDYLRAHRSLCVDLALTIAEAVLGRRPADETDALVGIFERAVARLDPPEDVRVRLARRDYEALETGLAPELQGLASKYGVALVPDADLAPGDLVVEGAKGHVDARRGELLRALREELHAALETGEAS